MDQISNQYTYSSQDNQTMTLQQTQIDDLEMTASNNMTQLNFQTNQKSQNKFERTQENEFQINNENRLDNKQTIINQFDNQSAFVLESGLRADRKHMLQDIEKEQQYFKKSTINFNKNNQFSQITTESNNSTSVSINQSPLLIQTNKNYTLIEEEEFLETSNLGLSHSKRKYIPHGCDIFSRPHFNKQAHLRRKKMKKAVKKSVGRWSHEESKRFVQGVELFEDNWDLVEDYVGTRNRKQIENFALKMYGSLSFSKTVKQQDKILNLEKKEENEKSLIHQSGNIQRNMSKSHNPKQTNKAGSASYKSIFLKLTSSCCSSLLKAHYQVEAQEEQERLEQQLKNFIALTKRFQNLYQIQSQLHADPLILENIKKQINELITIVGDLSKKNSLKKRELKATNKYSNQINNSHNLNQQQSYSQNCSLYSENQLKPQYQREERKMQEMTESNFNGDLEGKQIIRSSTVYAPLITFSNLSMFNHLQELKSKKLAVVSTSLSQVSENDHSNENSIEVVHEDSDHVKLLYPNKNRKSNKIQISKHQKEDEGLLSTQMTKQSLFYEISINNSHNEEKQLQQLETEETCNTHQLSNHPNSSRSDMKVIISLKHENEGEMEYNDEVHNQNFIELSNSSNLQ